MRFQSCVVEENYLEDVLDVVESSVLELYHTHMMILLALGISVTALLTFFRYHKNIICD